MMFLLIANWIENQSIKGLRSDLFKSFKTTTEIILIAFILLFLGCKSPTESSFNDNNDGVNPPVVDNSIDIGKADTFEVVTWNLMNFPADPVETINYLSELMPYIGADIFAVQEIANISAFQALLEALPDYNGIVMTSDSYQNLGFIYQSNEITVISYEEIMPWEDNIFMRIPLLININWHGQLISLITVHLKANDSGFEDEYKRSRSCELLDEYITTNLNDSRVIVLGDMNDELTDTATENVFQAFLTKPTEYLFTDMVIAEAVNTSNASYPSYPSHIDHILITNELFDAFSQPESLVRTLQVDLELTGGLYEYRTYISDHRPVGVRLDFNQD
ncbi:MAG: endonuclease/exonuclease/phosphatase family protein [Candidatus Cloacimonetes bacterium]|nr:endonuclease/exonuclease/phosphatase family protein [Candidatus Cloacimonadota bacterium]